MDVIMPFMQLFEEKSRAITTAGYTYMLVASPKGSSTCFVSSPPHCKADKLRNTYDTAIKECTYLLTGKRPLASHFVELPKKEQELADLKAQLEANKAHLKELEAKHTAEVNARLDEKALKKVLSAKGTSVTRYYESGFEPRKFTLCFRENVFFDQTRSGVIFFNEGKDKSEQASSAIALANIKAVHVGNRTGAFKRSPGDAAKPDCTFSVVSTEHTLELECKTTKVRDQWVRGLQALARAKNINLNVINS